MYDLLNGIKFIHTGIETKYNVITYRNAISLMWFESDWFLFVMCVFSLFVCLFEWKKKQNRKWLLFVCGVVIILTFIDMLNCFVKKHILMQFNKIWMAIMSCVHLSSLWYQIPINCSLKLRFGLCMWMILCGVLFHFSRIMRVHA